MVGSRSAVIVMLSLVGGCDDNPFAGWNERVDAHDKLRARIEETSGLFEASDPLGVYTISDVDIYRVDPTPPAFTWTPGQPFDATITWTYVTNPSMAFDRVEGVAYRFASEGRMMTGAGQPTVRNDGGAQTFHFELPADACVDISASCLVLPLERYVIFRTEGLSDDRNGRRGVVPAQPPGSVSIRCGTCSGPDCEEAPEC